MDHNQDSKTIEVEVSVPLLKRQLEMLRKIQWGDNTYLGTCVQALIGNMIREAEKPDERLEMRIIGFDEKQTEAYKKQLKDTHKITE